MISVGSAGEVIFRRGKKFNVGILSDTVNVINVKLCMMVLLTVYACSYHFSDLDRISRSQQC